MKELDIYPIRGLFYELYQPNSENLKLVSLDHDSNRGLESANDLFWAELLSERNIRDMITALSDSHQFVDSNNPFYSAIIEKPDIYLERVSISIENITDQSISPQDFFSAVETLSLLCKLYSDLIYTPFQLNIADGFLLDETSSEKLISEALSPASNPYLPFLKRECFPVIEKSKPELVWLHGRITMSSLAMAMYTRKLFPNAHICVIDHASEYYSMSKISRYLQRNQSLFSVIDSIILEETKTTSQQLRAAVADGRSLASINNILFIDHSDGRIRQTSYSEQSSVCFDDYIALRPRPTTGKSKGIEPYEILSLKLFPELVCPWRKCTFCGINSKYHVEGKDEASIDLQSRVDQIGRLAEEGHRFFWFIDEAIPPGLLLGFAQAILEKGIKITWQARSRMEEAFTSELCQTLYEAGLREMRFGLESACSEVLQRMNKFPPAFSMEMVETLVARFSLAGISIHFPIIIGFPGETCKQRKETYRFLAYLVKKYPMTSFNINILEMDVSSYLYRNFEEFEITALKLPCSPQYFLGNTVEAWGMQDGWFDKTQLITEQSGVMRSLLYPWMPKTAIIPPNIFYRLTETIRNTLIWKSYLYQPLEKKEFTPELRLKLGQYVVAFTLGDYAQIVDLCYYREVDLSATARGFLEMFQRALPVSKAISLFIKRQGLNPEDRPKLVEIAAQAYEIGLLDYVEGGQINDEE